MKKRMMLYFGSFNPVHRGHIALAEHVLEKGLCDEVALIVSPQSPYKQQEMLAPEMDRFEMAELACAASKHPEKIKASAIELLLPKPSYTIDTLRYLTQNFGSEMEFSILLGADQIAQFDGWKEYDRILEYPVWIYPRQGASIDRFADRIRLLEDAPLLDISSTDIRARIERGEETSEVLCREVADYIGRKGFWSAAARIATLTSAIDAGAEKADLYIERGKLHYRHNEWGAALNDFNRALKLDPAHEEAQQFAQMIQEILEFRYKDIYNP